MAKKLLPIVCVQEKGEVGLRAQPDSFTRAFGKKKKKFKGPFDVINRFTCLARMANLAVQLMWRRSLFYAENSMQRKTTKQKKWGQGDLLILKICS